MQYGHRSFSAVLALLLAAGTGIAALAAPHARTTQRAAATTAPAAPAAGPQTLLDGVGRLVRAVPVGQYEAWRQEVKRGHPAPARAAWLHVWLGEYQLAARQEPGMAMWHFRRAQKVAGRSDPAHGLAAYDAAIALFYQGAYAKSDTAFRKLLRAASPARGYDRRTCALWSRHAGACAGYHAERGAMGIPEPERLDPQCGAASLAACLRALGRPYDRQTVLAACRVTGEGSTLQDLLDACRKLGASGRAITADDRGLRLLPKPLIAHAERDHFIVVVRAGRSGVSYLCSDCGPWPGGRVDLTWKQWHAMAPGIYLAVGRPGSPDDRSISQVAAAARPAGAAGLRVAFARSRRGAYTLIA